MKITNKCTCGRNNAIEVSVDWYNDGSIPIECQKCGNIYVVSAYNTHQEESNELKEQNKPNNNKVIIINKQCEFYKKEGTIIDKNLEVYFIEFESGEMKWFPRKWFTYKKDYIRNKIARIILVILLCVEFMLLVI